MRRSKDCLAALHPSTRMFHTTNGSEQEASRQISVCTSNRPRECLVRKRVETHAYSHQAYSQLGSKPQETYGLGEKDSILASSLWALKMKHSRNNRKLAAPRPRNRTYLARPAEVPS